MKEKMKLLIAYDGSHSGNEMLDDLHQAGLPENIETLLLMVAELPALSAPTFGMAVPDITQDAMIELKKQTRALATQACEQLRKSFPGWQVSCETPFGLPAQEILKKASHWHPDLILVGAQGKTLLGRFIFGSVSKKVVNEAACPVRVGRIRRHKDGPIKILIGTDGSPEATAAVHAVAARKWPQGSEARLFTAINENIEAEVTSNTGITDSPQDNDKPTNTTSSQLDMSQSLMETYITVLREAGLDVSVRLEDGDAGYLLINESEQWPADVIFLGARGLSRLQRLLLGSVSSAVVANAQCSVEVVHGEKHD